MRFYDISLDCIFELTLLNIDLMWWYMIYTTYIRYIWYPKPRFLILVIGVYNICIEHRQLFYVLLLLSGCISYTPHTRQYTLPKK